jgi:hypothetical protein
MQTGKMKRMALSREPQVVRAVIETEGEAEVVIGKTIKHVGGGFYELPDGTKIKGKAKAEAALADL